MTDPSTTKALLAGLVVLSAGLAGCADAGQSEEVASFGSFEEAKRAPGTVWQASNTDTPIELRLLHPSDKTVETGEHEIVFLLYDSEANEPVEGVTFEPQSQYDANCSPRHSFCAEMPDMGHGTSPEESPEPMGHGVYRGMTTFSMDGDWRLNVNPAVDGEVLEFDISLTAQGSGEGDMSHER